MILRSFYNGACSIASKHDSDDQFFLLATVRNMKKKMQFILLHWFIDIKITFYN
jgi:hypothetical protein